MRRLRALALALLLPMCAATPLPAHGETEPYASAGNVTWSDTSLGCPQPGQVYAQVLTPGYRITLYAPTLIYEYHVAAVSGRVVLCGVTPNPGYRTIEQSRTELCAASARMPYWCLYASNQTIAAEYRRLNPAAAPPAT